MLWDRGYQGLLKVIRAVHSKNAPLQSYLTADEIWTNFKIFSDKVIVDNWFQRKCILWTVVFNEWCWKETLYSADFSLEAALTTTHTRFHPLREDDGKFCRAYKNSPTQNCGRNDAETASGPRQVQG